VRFLRILNLFFKGLEERRLAEQRSYDLLAAYLSPSQMAQFRTQGRFEVTGVDTNHRYVIRNVTTINVDELDSSGTCSKRWCFVPKGDLPQGDVLLAQKLALECFETSALEAARAFTPDGFYISQASAISTPALGLSGRARTCQQS
jgi:hypothetical protein